MAYCDPDSARDVHVKVANDAAATDEALEGISERHVDVRINAALGLTETMTTVPDLIVSIASVLVGAWWIASRYSHSREDIAWVVEIRKWAQTELEKIAAGDIVVAGYDPQKVQGGLEQYVDTSEQPARMTYTGDPWDWSVQPETRSSAEITEIG